MWRSDDLKLQYHQFLIGVKGNNFFQKLIDKIL